MSLIKDLQNDILNQDIKISTILRRAKVLASNLKNENFRRWVDNELNGYRTVDELPDYRKSHVECYGTFAGPFGSAIRNAPIPIFNLPEEFKKMKNLFLTEGARSLESLVESDAPSFQSLLPPELVAFIGNRIYNGYNCISAWRLVERPKVEQVLDTIRNKLLNFIIDLQEKYPDIKKSEESYSKIPKDQLAYSVNTFIFGDGNIVASGVDIDQSISQDIEKNNLDSLMSYLKSMGFPEKDIIELKIAVKKDGERKKPGKFGPNVARWIGSAIKKIAEGSLNIAISTAPLLITKALRHYYDWQ